jgi:hypothetical protein
LNGCHGGRWPEAREALERAVIAAWGADEQRPVWPERRVAELVAEKYAREAWNLRH